ncbi:MAG: site-specific integrase [Gemmataceae bacterium]|nr:site-specific integrase [Gemmataceae bacterium]
MANSTRSHQDAKPTSRFPLTLHPTGRWVKKIRGKQIYFGKHDPDNAKASAQAALDLFKAERREWEAGRNPRQPTPVDTRLTVDELCRLFFHFKTGRVQTGELSPRSLAEYDRTCKRLVRVFGKTHVVETLGPADFARLREDIASKWGLVRLGNEIQRVRSVFTYAHTDCDLAQPIRFGQAFTRPSQHALDLLKAEAEKEGRKMYSKEEILKFLDNATPRLRAMILLALNCGFGPVDLALLEHGFIKDGWVTMPRSKTGRNRRARVWPETRQAIEDYRQHRAVPAEDGAEVLVFLTDNGLPFAREAHCTEITKLMAKLENKLGTKLDRRGLYNLRHTFRTVAEEHGDTKAAGIVMGHKSRDISEHYIHAFPARRLEALAEYVRNWLFAKEGN